MYSDTSRQNGFFTTTGGMTDETVSDIKNNSRKNTTNINVWAMAQTGQIGDAEPPSACNPESKCGPDWQTCAP